MTARPWPALPAEFAVLHPDRWTAPFWDAARSHRLTCPRCVNCGEFRMPPSPFCWSCRTQEVDWVTLPGTGQIHTYTIVRHGLASSLKSVVPYAVALVALDGAPGARLVGAMVETDPERVRIGLPVRVVWDDVDVAVTIPRFALADDDPLLREARSATSANIH